MSGRRHLARGLVPAALLAASLVLIASTGSASTGSANLAHASAATTVELAISAQVDGNSDLVIEGHDAYWSHQSQAAPGRHEGSFPTMIGGKSWLPTWPEAGENRDCGCRSDTFHEVTPPLPATGPITFVANDCRSICTASTGNGKAVIHFDDVGIGGDSTYKVTLVYQLSETSKSSSSKLPQLPEIDPRRALTRIQAIAGDNLTVIRKGKRYAAGENAMLEYGDIVETGRGTRATLEFLIGGRVGINHNTKIEVTGEREVEGPDFKQAVVKKGSIWTKADAAGLKRPLEIQTNGGVFGIKG